VNKAAEAWKSFWIGAVGGRRAGYLVRYVIVGLLNTAWYTVLLILFLNKTSFPHPFSVGLAFVLSMAFQYFANKYFTFRTRALSLREALRYISVALANYLLSVAVVWVALDTLHLPKVVVSILSSGIVAVTGFLLSRFWVYRTK
jgi:putative flippase GtrA